MQKISINDKNCYFHKMNKKIVNNNNNSTEQTTTMTAADRRTIKSKMLVLEKCSLTH